MIVRNIYRPYFLSISFLFNKNLKPNWLLSKLTSLSQELKFSEQLKIPIKVETPFESLFDKTNGVLPWLGSNRLHKESVKILK